MSTGDTGCSGQTSFQWVPSIRISGACQDSDGEGLGGWEGLYQAVCCRIRHTLPCLVQTMLSGKTEPFTPRHSTMPQSPHKDGGVLQFCGRH